MKRIDRFDPSPFRSQVAAQIDDFDPLDHMDPKTARQLDRFSHFGLAAGQLALGDASISTDATAARAGADPDRFGIYLGSALGGIAYAEGQHERYLERGIRSVAPNLALAVFGGAAPANIGIALGLRGPILSTANSCASGAVALGEALRAIRDGTIDAAIAGGAEVPLSPLAFGAFDIIRALSPGSNDAPERAARPFDAARDGFVMGEGVGLLVLEAEEVARARGVEPYAQLMGYGSTSDAFHMVQPRADGREAARAVTLALADAGVGADELDYANAHASSTPLGDVAEARALALALGRAGAHDPRERDEGPLRPPARRFQRDRGGDLLAGHPPRLDAGHGRTSRRPIPRSWSTCRACWRKGGTAATGGCCRRRSGSAGSTRRWSSAPSTPSEGRAGRRGAASRS